MAGNVIVASLACGLPKCPREEAGPVFILAVQLGDWYRVTDTDHLPETAQESRRPGVGDEAVGSENHSIRRQAGASSVADKLGAAPDSSATTRISKDWPAT